jgi:CheY-like chemotaxis protein
MPKTLLLADDSVTIQRVIELTFAHEDIRVVSVSDGRRAVQWLEGEWPDIVLADVDIPEVDGYALTEFIKQSPRLKEVPVLLLAGAFEPVDQDRVRAIGCDGVLVKPFEPQQLVSRVKALLDRVAEPALAGRSGESGRESGRHEGDSSFASPSFSSSMRPPFGDFEHAGDPEPLEPPSRPVWELGLPETVQPARSAAPAAAAPAPPPPAATPLAAAPKVSLVSAFSALLAAEQSSTPAPAAVAPLTEASVEDAVKRVLVRMTDDLVRRIVLETAERLIREEIEKIKANPE